MNDMERDGHQVRSSLTLIRTHLLSFFLVGIVSMLDSEEPRLRRCFTGIRLSRRKRTDEKCDKDLCELHSHMRPEPSPPGLYGVLFVACCMIPRLRAGCAFFSLSPSAIMCALDGGAPQKFLVGICMIFQICLDPSV